MHKLAMEMAKKLMDKACDYGYDKFNSQDWDDFKDAMEATEKAIKADYYYHIVEAMKKEEEDEEAEEKFILKEFMDKLGEDDGRRFYDRWRYKSGRFAPKGRGHRSGYTPYLHMMDDMYDEEPFMPELTNYRMGYPMGKDSMRSDGMKDGRYNHYDDNRTGRNEGSKYGKSYDRYDDARRHYHDTKDMDSMRKMEESFGDILDDFGEIADDTWKDLTPEQKNKQKPKINQMIQKLQKLQQM